MQPSKEMQSFVNACELLHKTYLDNPGDRLKMRLGKNDLPLVIDRLTETTIRVAHEKVGEYGLIQFDPAVVFFTGYEKWIAMEISQPSSLATEIGRIGTEAKYLKLNSSGRFVDSYVVSKQKSLANFVKEWARVLRARGWHENSTNAKAYQTRFNEEGEVDTGDDDEGATDPNHPGLRLMDGLAELAERGGVMTDELRQSYQKDRARRAAANQPAGPLEPEEDEGDTDEDDEGEAATERLRDKVGDLLINEGLMDDTPRNRSRRRGGISSVTISSGDRSVTMTGKH